MPTYWFAFVISVMAAASVAEPVDDIQRAAVATALLAIAWGVLAKTAVCHAAIAAQRSPEKLSKIEGQLYRNLGIIRWAWIPAGFVAISQFGWDAVSLHLLGALGFTSIRTLQAVLLIAPGLSVACVIWWCEHQWGIWLDHVLSLKANRRKTAIAYVFDSFRLHALWMLLPMLGVLAAMDGIRWANQTDGQVDSKWALLVLLFVPLLLPLAVRMAWRTKPLSNRWLSAVLAAARVPGLSIRSWDTDHRISTALLVGVLPKVRMLIVSDRLVDQLTRPQLAMVLLHEIAHLNRFHLVLRLVAVLPIWAFVSSLSVFIVSVWMHGAFLLLGALLTAAMLRWVSHLTEYDADQAACRLAVEMYGTVDDVPNSAAWAARELTSALEKITSSDHNSRKGTWLHPSLSARITRLTILNAPKISTGTCPATGL